MNESQDREITLGTSMILAIFFSLAVLCAIFFGFGYSLGRKSLVATVLPTTQPLTSSVIAGTKPSSANANDVKHPAAVPSAVSATVVPLPAASRPAEAETVASSGDPTSNAGVDGLVVGDPANAKQPSPSVGVSAAKDAAGGVMVVQVAAVSHPEDADLLITTLKRRGYAVAIHKESQDQLLHVQVGPFASHAEAEAMRQRLMADGFNAIIKGSK